MSEQERIEARKALESAATIPWTLTSSYYGASRFHVTLSSGCTITLYNENDARLIANAPTWLRNALERERLLIEERERSLIYENELIEIIRKDRERIAEQDKEIQALQKEIAELKHRVIPNMTYEHLFEES
jgi:hypothetical protein